jgi:septum formation protein
MLRHLRDVKSHKVFTGVACIAPLEVPIHPGYCIRTTVEETTVYFGKADVITDEVLRAYVESGEGTDAAGGYKVQEGGGVLVERIVGDYSNVVGLPVHAVSPLQQSLIIVVQTDRYRPESRGRIRGRRSRTHIVHNKNTIVKRPTPTIITRE